MHNNYYFFRHLVPSLSNKIIGSYLSECFSQDKDELILKFEKESKEVFFIKAHLKPVFSCLAFPDQFHRAKRNSINLFSSIKGHSVQNISQYLNERAFSIQFSNNQLLLFKLFGNQSNIVLLEKNKVIELFKNNLVRDKNIDLTTLNRLFEISFESLKENDWNVKKTIPTLDRKTAQALASKIELTANANQEFESFMEELEDCAFFLEKIESDYRLSLIKSKNAIKVFSDPIVAINTFFEKQIKNKALTSIKTKLITHLNGQLVKSDNYIRKLLLKLKALSVGVTNQQKADILMAHLHFIDTGAKSVDLPNFYDSQIIKIKLNPLLSPQKNAERYYRKSKNEAKEISIINKNIANKQKLITNLKLQLSTIETEKSTKILQNLISKKTSSKKGLILPYKEFYIDKFHVFVGKNAKHNDTLTLKIAKKDDLWFHAKDVSGSHVVVKQIPGTNYPIHVIEKAAQLAAYYSKRKTDSLCPVLYTPKKYVRKKKGTPTGAMFVEKEKVILVEPSNQVH